MSNELAALITRRTDRDLPYSGERPRAGSLENVTIACERYWDGDVLGPIEVDSWDDLWVDYYGV